MPDRNRRLAKIEATIEEMDRPKRNAVIMVYEPSPTGPRLVDIIRPDELEGRWERNGRGTEEASEPIPEDEFWRAATNGGELGSKE